MTIVLLVIFIVFFFNSDFCFVVDICYLDHYMVAIFNPLRDHLCTYEIFTIDQIISGFFCVISINSYVVAFY